MQKYATIIDDNKKICSVGIGTNYQYYESIGMSLMDVEKGYDGTWYITGYAPQEPIENMKYNVRMIRDSYLEKTDKYMLIDFPIIEDVKQKYIKYRNYLRNYTNQKNWWKYNPKTFEEWDNNNES